MNAHRGQEGLLSPDSVLHRAAERLAHQFAGMASEETVERVVFESYTALARTATISSHLHVEQLLTELAPSMEVASA